MYQLNPTLASDQAKLDLLGELRPREKLLKYGPSRMSESELLSLILGSGCQGASALNLAQQLCSLIFQRDGTSRSPSLEECLSVKGLGQAKASAVLASLELGSRFSSCRGRPIHQPMDALPHLSWLGECRRERFHVLYLDSRRRLLASNTVSLGTLDSSLVHPREVFREAIELNASALLVAHNHPSGDPEPSPDDLALTARLSRAARLLGFVLVDHLIIGGKDWISLREQERQGEEGLTIFAI